MATTDITATDHNDFLSQLVTFITSNGWSLLKDETIADERFVYLRGLGLSGTSDIYIFIRRYTTALNGFNWEIHGSLGFNTSVPFEDQPGLGPPVYAILGSLSTPDIVAKVTVNARRMIISAGISNNTIPITMYLGLILPYATDTQYPNPLFVGATGVDENQSLGDGNELRSFFNPLNNLVSLESNSYLLSFSNSWIPIGTDEFTGTETRVARSGLRIWPWVTNFSIRSNADGTYTLLEPIFYSNDGNIYGTFDGFFWVSGDGNSYGNTIDVNGTEHLVVNQPNVTGPNNFGAMILDN